jgi:uncharacterized protein (DUF2267 family)
VAEIISELAAKAGISPDQAEKGLGAVLALLKDKLPAGIFNQVQSAVPNANSMMAAAQSSQEASGGGILEAVTKAAGKLFGGGGAAADLANKLTHLGFSAEQLQQFIPRVIEFIKSKLPADAAKQVSALMPSAETAEHAG